MRIGACQFTVRPGDPAANRARIRAALSPAEFDLLVLPELCTSGLPYATRVELAADAETIPDGPTCTLLAELARDKEAVIVAGMAERAGDHLYNSAVVVGPAGLLGRQRKLHLSPDEKSLFDTGIETAVFHVGNVNVGVVLGNDGWFPEVSRLLMLRGAQILCNPTRCKTHWPPELMRVRAMENVVFAISATTCDPAAGEAGNGSQVVGPDGEVLLRAGGRETIEVVEVDPAPALSRRNQFCDDLLKELERYSAYRPFIQPDSIH